MSDMLNKDQHLTNDPPLVEGNHTFATITEKISSIVENKPLISGFMTNLCA